MPDIFKMSHEDNAMFFGYLAGLSILTFTISGFLPIVLSIVACTMACVHFVRGAILVEEIGLRAVARELFGS